MTMIEGRHQEKETQLMIRTMQIVARAPVVEKERIETLISVTTAINKLTMKAANIISSSTKEGISIITTIVVVLLVTIGVVTTKIVVITTSKVVEATIVAVATIRSTSITITIKDALVITKMINPLKEIDSHQESSKEGTQNLM